MTQAFDPAPRQAPRLPGDDFNVPFEEAIAWARARKAVLPEEFYGARLQSVRARSFAIAGLAALDQVQQVADSAAEAIASGKTLREWQRNLPPDVASLGKARRELIFRNAVQTSYGVGRTIQQRENAANRPYLMWDAINDSRTRPAHRAMDGHVAPVDDPIWRRWVPPAGHNCFLPGTRVRGDFRVGLQTRYAGPAVEVLTRAGARLSVTGNHPVLTSRGWVAAKDIQVGDDLLCHRWVVDPAPLAVEHDEDLPPTVEEVFAALASQALGVAKRAAFHLHGDAQFGEGEVNVAGADGVLMYGVKPLRAQSDEQRQFIATDHRAACGELHAARASFGWSVGASVLHDKALHIAARRPDGVGNHAGPEVGGSVQRYGRFLHRFVARVGRAPCGGALALDSGAVVLHRGPFHGLGFAAPADACAVPYEQGAHGAARDADFGGESFLARADRVLREQLRHAFRGVPRPRLRAAPHGGSAVLERAALHAGIAQQTVEEAVADGGLFQALSHRFPGDVSADQVISIRHFTFSGHVYDFETKQGWLSAGGVIVSNCRCSRISLTESQARARGYPKAAPNVDPDAGWAGDPTEGNEDLVSVIQARQASCMTTFAAKGSKGRWLSCDDGPAMEKLLQAAAELSQNGRFHGLKPADGLNKIDAGQFSQADIYRRFASEADSRIDRAQWADYFDITVAPDKSFFLRQDGSWKITKNARAQWIDFLADTLIDPAEVRLVEHASNAMAEIRLIGGYRLAGRDLYTVLVLKKLGDLWRGWSAFDTTTDKLEHYRRSSMLVWLRK